MSFHAGNVALVGRPNAGKSTLLNRLAGTTLAAVSPRPQTTRTRVAGLYTTLTMQAVLFDTPGIHRAFTELNRRMVHAAEAALDEADVVCWLVDATAWRGYDALVGDRLKGRRLVIALNKVDRLPREKLLPILAELAPLDCPIVPISAKTGDGVDALTAEWAKLLPEGEAIFPEDQAGFEPERNIAAELVREQVFHLCGEEVPYAVAIEIERFDESLRETAGRVHIHAKILVEKPGQKAIVIGAGGAMIKRIGTAARKRIEELLGCKVRLDLFVVVEPEWTTKPKALRALGYE